MYGLYTASLLAALVLGQAVASPHKHSAHRHFRKHADSLEVMGE